MQWQRLATLVLGDWPLSHRCGRARLARVTRLIDNSVPALAVGQSLLDLRHEVLRRSNVVYFETALSSARAWSI